MHNRSKRIISILMLLCLMTALTACGKQNGKINKTDNQANANAGHAQQEFFEDGMKKAYGRDNTVIDMTGWLEEQDSYEYPEANPGEGLSYADIRGLWFADIEMDLKSISYSDDMSEVERLENIIKAVGKEIPISTKTVLLRFTDEQNVEGRIIVNKEKAYDVMMEMYGTDDGIRKLYGVFYGISKGEVDYSLEKMGLDISDIREEFLEEVENELGKRDYYYYVLEFKDTYRIRENRVIFDDLGCYFEFDADAGTMQAICGQSTPNTLSAMNGHIFTIKK